jgi:hypothetical protein
MNNKDIKTLEIRVRNLERMVYCMTGLILRRADKDDFLESLNSFNISLDRLGVDKSATDFIKEVE